MNIVLVIDQFDQANNGTTNSARRFAKTLREHGHQVTVVTTGEPGEGKVIVPTAYVPLVTEISRKQGMTFGKADRDILRSAFAGADVVHFSLPTRMCCVGERVAREMGVACTAAFHLQPENVTYIIHLGRLEWLARFIYRFFRNIFYQRFTHIHCPSHFIAGELRKHGYTAQLHVISNGIGRDFTPQPRRKPKELEGRFTILMVGRYSPEKRQDLLIEAARLSRHAERIQLILAGRGPCEKKLRRLGAKLPHPPIFDFYDHQGLLETFAATDLYVHTADVEIEAISCMEAFACGLVPLIANSGKSATPQFALDQRSLFEAGNAKDLADKIDYFIEHPKELEALGPQYAQRAKAYGIDACVDQIEEMFKQAIAETGRAV